MSMKYPRSMHLPFSPGTTSDDRIMTDADLDFLLQDELVITEKLDGSNVCLTSTNVHARSHAGPPTHKSFDTLKPLHDRLKHSIPDKISVFGEWTYAVHSIEYTILPAHLFVFGIRDDEMGFWWSWDDVAEFTTNTLGIPTVPVILRGMFPDKEIFEKIVVDLANLSSIYGPTREGLVIRHASELYDVEYGSGKKMAGLGKWVRKGHVQHNAEHWSRRPIRVQPTLTFFQKNDPVG